ncbi:phosphatase PAP2 family protein [Mycolicibacterium moriokaense]|jgi:undecaprenyl-diphosphatase|uniref:Phosphatase PAP2 family protein n=2 Tax=Mycolicibacterium moriokaense TaxID=39691 RepID=A0AAD1HHJ1_9MYCO|nr:phosphatase PAP2 family protein [Mycolicibacterium moriokaense]MCV7042408.1 phosphatase PAP2 family protein [Mycolicibacterium moriokaense]ORB22989.1 phosphatase PAP2 family protein [Mycolicibacterium moriokaense]BBX05186.1 phosphatase PAP2 family protein [Mycolicibacterium moriokaense]
MASRTRWLIGTAVAALGVYVLMWIAYVSQWKWLTAMDSAALDLAHDYGVIHPGWVTGWDVFCTVLGPAAFRLVGLVIVVVALWRRNLRLAGFLALTAGLSGPLIELAKYIVGRPRPATALVHAQSMSFPSGHALGVLVAVLALMTIIWPFVRPPLRGWLVALGALIVVFIGIGRVVLNVHHPSDVIAGWALGYAFFVCCLLILPPRPPVTAAADTPQALDTAR